MTTASSACRITRKDLLHGIRAPGVCTRETKAAIFARAHRKVWHRG